MASKMIGFSVSFSSSFKFLKEEIVCKTYVYDETFH